MARRAVLVYAAAMIVAGLAWGWGAPLGSDEERYYLPAAKWFAARGAALDYPMPMPPFALMVQGLVYRLTESVFVLRMLSTLAAIGAVAVAGTMTQPARSAGLGVRWQSHRSGTPTAAAGAAALLDARAWLLFMFGTFPAALMNAFSLKHHAIVLLCCVGAFALWQRQRVALAAVVLAIGALTHQFAGAMIATLAVLSLLERRYRDAALVALSGLPLAVLVLLWGGARPPMHEATFTGEPAMSGVQPVQLLVLLFMAGTWIAPAVRLRRPLVAMAALPLTAIWMHAAGLMQPAGVYERLAGPVSSLIVAVTRDRVLVAAIAAGALAALGVALYAEKRPQFLVWSAMYALVMFGVPYFFESYYALFVTVGWMLLREEIGERPPWFPIVATLAGIGYVIAKA